MNKVYYDQFSYICNPLQDQMNWRKFKFSDLKEDKKVKKEIDFSKIPYFEVKMVKVKKGENVPNLEKKQGECKVYTPGWCGECPRIPKRFGKKANIVNGENLDLIKFPCLCEWNNHIGMIINDYWNDETIYTLVGIDKQTNNNHTYSHSKSLKDLIIKYDLHIRKGKILIFTDKD